MGLSGQLLTARRARVTGLVKSGYYSLTRTGRYDTFLLSKEVITEISKGADIQADAGLMMGIGRSSVTHQRVGRSKLHLKDEAVVRFPADDRAYFGPCSVLTVEGDFTMGDTHFNADATVICGESITIGDGGRFAWDVTILDDNRHSLMVDGVKREQKSPIEIGDNVWIGHGVTITKGVTIGDGAVIGNDSVVTDDVPANSLAIGQPATVVSKDVSWQ